MGAYRLGSPGVKALLASATMLPILAIPGSQAREDGGPRPLPAFAIGGPEGHEAPLLAPAETSKSFTIRGIGTGPLVIGGSVPIVLAISNPNSRPITIRELSVAVATVKPSSPGAHCGAGDFAVRQVHPGTRLIVPAGRKVDFGSLDVPEDELPQVTMINRPAVNQDGCKGATVTLIARGSVSGGVQ